MTNRRTFIKNTAQAGAYSLFFTQLLACKSNSSQAEVVKLMKELNVSADAPYNMKYLRGDVGVFTERGGTIGWLVNKDGIVVVDTQFPEQSQHLIEEVKKVSDHSIDLLINTHHHGDHTSGNSVFKDHVGKILAHENSKKNQERVVQASNQEGQVFPNATFQDTHMEKAAGESIKLYYFGSGHTDGDTLTHFENHNIVHMGDLVFNRRFPYIDKSAGADIGNWVKVLDNALKTFDQDTIYIFGHSGNDYDITGTAEDLKAFQNYLEKLLIFGQVSIASGKTLEEVKAETTEIPRAPEWQGDGVVRSLEAVYTELGG